MFSERLSSGKSKGYDGIPAEVFKCGSCALFQLMVRLFSLMVKFDFLPAQLMKVVVVPIVKVSTVNASLSANYRPMAIKTAASRFMETIIQ